MKYILDINFILDTITNRDGEASEKYLLILKDCLIKESAYISSSSVHNIRFLLNKYYSDFYDIYIQLEAKLKIVKVPSYIDRDAQLYKDDIEDYLIELSAKSIDARIITSDKKFLKKSTLTISPDEYLLKKMPKEKNIDFANLKHQYFMYQPELELAMDKVLKETSYIMGDAVVSLEKNLQTFTGAKHAITCSSGTDALLLAMMALDIKPSDEIITTPFTFIATAETIAFLGAKPVFVDIDEKTYNLDPKLIEAKITSKTKAIMPVSLYGQPADIDAIQAIIEKVEGRREKVEGRGERGEGRGDNPSTSKIKIIIDGAQSFGSTYKGKTDSNLGDISTTSFFPAKPLGCFGDGGAVFTNDDALAEKMKSLRVHGQSKRYHHKYIGMGGRMDTIQCAIVDVKLKHYKKDLALRQEVARKYDEIFRERGEGRREKENEWLEINPSTFILLPSTSNDRTSAYAQYSIRITPSPLTLHLSSSLRDELQAKLKEQGIPTAVHYPMPLHLQECFAYLGYKKGDFPIAELISNEIMSLPMNPYLSDDEIAYISKIFKNHILSEGNN